MFNYLKSNNSEVSLSKYTYNIYIELFLSARITNKLKAILFETYFTTYILDLDQKSVYL